MVCRIEGFLCRIYGLQCRVQDLNFARVKLGFTNLICKKDIATTPRSFFLTPVIRILGHVWRKTTFGFEDGVWAARRGFPGSGS